MEERRRRRITWWKSMAIRIGNERDEGGLSSFLLLKLFPMMNKEGEPSGRRRHAKWINQIEQNGNEEGGKEWMGGILGFVLMIGV